MVTSGLDHWDWRENVIGTYGSVERHVEGHVDKDVDECICVSKDSSQAWYIVVLTSMCLYIIV